MPQPRSHTKLGQGTGFPTGHGTCIVNQDLKISQYTVATLQITTNTETQNNTYLLFNHFYGSGIQTNLAGSSVTRPLIFREK